VPHPNTHAAAPASLSRHPAPTSIATRQVSGLRWPQPTTHARLLAEFAFAAEAIAQTVPIHPGRPELGHVAIRVGLHSGPVVASVVGTLNRRCVGGVGAAGRLAVAPLLCVTPCPCQGLPLFPNIRRRVLPGRYWSQ
jgi:hypothetical protein